MRKPGSGKQQEEIRKRSVGRLGRGGPLGEKELVPWRVPGWPGAARQKGDQVPGSAGKLQGEVLGVFWKQN